jgi:uncharacterized protein (TIGR03083 family)
MLIERDLDCASLYRRERRALMELARSLSPEQLAIAVPATPDWMVKDVLAHLVGITADLNAQRFGQEYDSPDEWTDAQVTSRRDRTVDQLDDEWEREADAFEPGLSLLGYEIGSHYIGDLLQHVVDVRAALGVTQADHGDALDAGLDFYVDSFHGALLAAGVGPVVLRWSESHGAVTAGRESDDQDQTTARLDTTAFELFRTLGGRRSENQVRGLDWSGDVDRVIPHVSRYPLPQHDLVD